MPERFCIPLKGIQPHDKLCVGAYPVAWRVEATETGRECYFHWATSDTVWDLQDSPDRSGHMVRCQALALVDCGRTEVLPPRLTFFLNKTGSVKCGS